MRFDDISQLPKHLREQAYEQLQVDSARGITEVSKTLATYESEDDAKIAVFQWADSHMNVYPELKYCHHSPNGGSRHKAEGAKFKRMGTRAGFPDIIFPYAMAGYVGMVIEMKVGDNVTTKLQDEWLDHFRLQGWSTHIEWGSQAAIDRMKWYLELER